MKTAIDIMTREVLVFSPELDIAQATRLLLEKGVNGAPVLNAKGELVGILCQSDLVAQQKKLSLPSLFSLLDGYVPLPSMTDLDREMEKISALKVEQAMTKDPTSVTPETPLDEIATLMVERGFHSLPVLSEGKLLGIIGMQDILRTLVEK